MIEVHVVFTCPIRKANPYRQMAKAMKTNSLAPNRVNREFEEHGPGKILLTDITYVKMLNGKFSYLSTIKDAYTKQILAYRVSDSLSMDFVMETMNDLKQNHGEGLQPNCMRGDTTLADILPMKWILEKTKLLDTTMLGVFLRIKVNV